MRASHLFRFVAAASSGHAAVRPYRRVQQAIDEGGRGLLVAAEVFKEFEARYRESVSAAARTSSLSTSPLTASTGTPTAQPYQLPTSKPLTAFCGSPREVEPLTILLLKVLCDLRKLEEMRFLFTQCVLELEDQTPSIELFNVYLLAVSMTDTFNEHEVENVVELLRVKGAQPDIVTKLSMLILYLRLGKEAHVATWWPLLRDEVESIVADGAVEQYPLLGLRLQHCFQTLVRLHYDAAAMQECLRLLKAVSPSRCTPGLLVPYMVLGVANQAVPPAAVVEVLEMLEMERNLTVGGANLQPDAPSSGSVSETASGVVSDALTLKTPLPPPALSSEGTAFRLLSKCAKWKDPASAAYVRDYLKRYSADFTIIAPENRPLAALLYVEALVQVGRVADALAVVEVEVPSPLNVPGERPKLFLQSRRMTLLPADPLTNLVHRVASDGGHGVDRIVAELRARRQAQDSRGDTARTDTGELGVVSPVTAVSLDLVMAVCAELQDTARAERLLALYASEFGTQPGPYTYAALLRSYVGSDAVSGVQRVRDLVRVGGTLANEGIALTTSLLRAMLEVCLSARDTEAGVWVLELHAEAGLSVDLRQSSRLLRELELLADVEGLKKALRAMRSSRSVIDQATVAQCIAALQKWGIDCEDLKSL